MFALSFRSNYTKIACLKQKKSRPIRNVRVWDGLKALIKSAAPWCCLSSILWASSCFCFHSYFYSPVDGRVGAFRDETGFASNTLWPFPYHACRLPTLRLTLSYPKFPPARTNYTMKPPNCQPVRGGFYPQVQHN